MKEWVPIYLEVFDKPSGKCGLYITTELLELVWIVRTAIVRHRHKNLLLMGEGVRGGIYY